LLPTELHWAQPKWTQRRYELKAGEQTIARFEYRGSWRPVAHAFITDQEITFRTGFLKTDIVIMDERSGAQIAVFKRSRPAAVSFTNGRTFRWKRQGFWSPYWTFLAPDNEVLVTLKRRSAFLRQGATVTLSSSAFKYPEVRILVTLGWYLLLAAAAQAAAAAS
jgi:hypothetical protein